MRQHAAAPDIRTRLILRGNSGHHACKLWRNDRSVITLHLRSCSGRLCELSCQEARHPRTELECTKYHPVYKLDRQEARLCFDGRDILFECLQQTDSRQTTYSAAARRTVADRQELDDCIAPARRGRIAMPIHIGASCGCNGASSICEPARHHRRRLCRLPVALNRS